MPKGNYSLLAQFDSICDEFESKWSPGERPDFEKFLTDVASSNRQQLLTMLVDLDVELRKAKKLEVIAADYSALGDEFVAHVENKLVARSDESSTGKGPFFGNSTTQPDGLASNNTVGPYKLIKKIGEGGMGVVWEAEQTNPVKRKVALKVIRSGYDRKDVLVRFEAERQALAMMNHPNIARIIDAGSTTDGRPYFAMEYVDGLPLTEYCDQNRLSIEKRLALFVDVCAGVQHAHQKGIIHRDLKPSNILVTMVDGQMLPKVIDFGLAKATQSTQRLSDASLNTQVGQVLGTLKYMSPEQANADELDIDTRSDIYSLGVILYQLLTGSTPLDDRSIKSQPIIKVMEYIREGEPIKPSRRLGGVSEQDRSTISQARQTDTAKLNRILVGDLDWIVMKSLEKERNRRYESAFGFSADVKRYLNSEPVVARPPSMKYRVQKFVRKNRTVVTAVTTVFLALIAGITLATVGFVNANTQREKAEIAIEKEIKANEAAQGALLQEKREREYAEAIANFVTNDFLALTSVEGQERFDGSDLDRNATLPDLLDRAAKKLTERQNLAPRIEAQLSWIIGVSYRASGKADQGIPYLVKCVNLRERLYGKRHQLTLNAKNSLAICYCDAGRLTNAIRENNDVLATKISTLGSNHPDTLDSKANAASFYKVQGDYKKAIQILEDVFESRKSQHGANSIATLKSMFDLTLCYEEAGVANEDTEEVFLLSFEMHKKAFGPEHSTTLSSMSNLAMYYQRISKYEKAKSLALECYELRKDRLGEDHPDTLSSVHSLVIVYQSLGDFKKAGQFAEHCLEFRKAKLGVNHRDTLASMNSLASCYKFSGNLQKAIPLAEKCVELMTKEFGENDLYTLRSMSNLAGCHKSAGRVGSALTLSKKCFEMTKRKLGDDHPEVLSSMNHVAICLAELGELDKATELAEECYALRVKKFGEEHLDSISSLNCLVFCYQAAGSYDKAIDAAKKCFSIRKAKLGAEHPDTISSMNNLAICYFFSNQITDAVSIAEECFELSKNILGISHPDTLLRMNSLSGCYRKAERLGEAIELAEHCFEAFSTKLGPDHPDTLSSLENLAACYRDSGQLEKAISLATRCYGKRKSILGDDHPDSLDSLHNLADCLRSDKKYSKAIPHYEKCLTTRVSMLGPEHPDTLSTMYNLAICYLETGLLEDAIRLAKECVEKETKIVGSNHRDTLACMNTLASCYRQNKQFEDAVNLFKKCLSIEESEFGRENELTLSTMAGLALSYQESLQLEKAMFHATECFNTRKKLLGPEHVDTLDIMSTLATINQQMRKIDTSIALAEECLRLQKKVNGTDHVDTLDTMHNLAVSYIESGQLEKAISTAKDCMNKKKAKLGPDDLSTLSTMSNLANFYQHAGHVDQAILLHHECLNIEKTKIGLNSSATYDRMNRLGVLYWRLKRLEKSIPMFEELVQLKEKHFGRDHLETQHSIGNLGVNYKDNGQFDSAILLLEEAYVASKSDSKLSWTRAQLKHTYLMAKRNSEFKEMAEEEIESARKQFANRELDLANVLNLNGQDFMQLGELDLAYDCLKEEFEIRQRLKPNSWLTFHAQSMLGNCQLLQDDFKNAEINLQAGYQGMKQRLLEIPEKVRTARLIEAIDRLIDLNKEMEQPDGVKKWENEKNALKKGSDHPVERENKAA